MPGCLASSSRVRSGASSRSIKDVWPLLWRSIHAWIRVPIRAAGPLNRGSGLTVEVGGYMGLAVAGLAAYIAVAELCEASYKRPILPLWPLARH